jgi:hypothetical protein
MKTLTRRDVFSLAGGAAALAAAGRLPLLGAAAMPAAATPIEGYLRAHAPAAGTAKPRLLEYAVLRWVQTDPATGETENVEIGRLEIEAAKQDDGVKLAVRQRTSYPRPVNRLEAEAVCGDDGWLTLRSWRVKSWIEERDDCLYEAKGEIVGTRGRIDDGISERMVYNLPAAVTSQWAIPMALTLGKAAAGGFTMLEDLALVKQDQVLAKGPAVRVPYEDAEHDFASWVHTGQGVLPIHYLVDANGLPQLMTQGVLAWALQRAA